jgi:hypothetical protein
MTRKPIGQPAKGAKPAARVKAPSKPAKAPRLPVPPRPQEPAEAPEAPPPGSISCVAARTCTPPNRHAICRGSRSRV